MARTSGAPQLHALQARAEALGIPCHQVAVSVLQAEVPDRRHGGVVAQCHRHPLVSWEELVVSLRRSARGGEAPLVLLPAAIEDPRNLGAMIRTAAGFCVSAVLLPRKGSAGLSAGVEETAAGALPLVPVSRPGNLTSALDELKADGWLVGGLHPWGQELSNAPDDRPTVLVTGGEDRGIPPHLRRSCDVLWRIPMHPQIQSYNAGVAASLGMYALRGNRTALAYPPPLRPRRPDRPEESEESD